MVPVDEDAELLRRFGAGDADAFVSFYRRNLAIVLAFFVRRTGNPELTADLAAETFAAALIAAPRFRPGGTSGRAWLLGIASHKLVDSRRRGGIEDRARRRLRLEPLTIDDLDMERVIDLSSPDVAALETAIQELPDEQREALFARVVDERSYAEIAAQMRCSEMVVRQRVSRGLKHLRSQFKDT